MNEDSRQFYQNRISDAWADIRAYGSDLWRIMALTVAASAIIIHLILSPSTTGSLMFFDLSGWISLFILTGFTFFSMMTILWISKAIRERIQMVQQWGKKFNPEGIFYHEDAKIKKENSKLIITPGEITRVLSWIPTSYLTQFSGLMWAMCIFFWYIQVPLASYGDSVIVCSLLLLQTIAVISMTIFLWRKRHT